MIALARAILAAFLCGCGLAAAADIRVQDDDSRWVTLRSPAKRIVSLAPHATELLFEAGAGSKIVATTRHSDHPEAARRIERVGDSHAIDVERIAALEPDLIVVWLHGNSAKQLEAIRKLGIPVFHTNPRRLSDIPAGLVRLGTLAGTEEVARQAAVQFQATLDRLGRSYGGRRPVRVFFQAWRKPLLTVNGSQIISDLISLCGGRNVFADLPVLVPTVDVESVLEANPEMVIATGPPDAKMEDVFSRWLAIAKFGPTVRGNLLLLKTDALGRPSARILTAAEMLCEGVDSVRRKGGQ